MEVACANTWQEPACNSNRWGCLDPPSVPILRNAKRDSSTAQADVFVPQTIRDAKNAQERKRNDSWCMGCETKGVIFRLLPGICGIVPVQEKLPGLSQALRNPEEAADSQEWLSHLLSSLRPGLTVL